MSEWVAVTDASAFCAFLERFRATLDAPARSMLDSSTWREAGVAAYLHAWARWLESVAPANLPVSLDSPSWSSLAFQMLSVRDAEPPAAELGAAVVSTAAEVRDVATFAQWLRHLGDECIDDQALSSKMAVRGQWAWETGTANSWRHGNDLDDYLEAWSACLNDGAELNMSTWTDFANLVTMGKYYE